MVSFHIRTYVAVCGIHILILLRSAATRSGLSLLLWFGTPSTRSHRQSKQCMLLKAPLQM